MFLHVLLYLQILAAKKTSLHWVFPVFLVVFAHNLLYWEFKNRYSKKPVSVTKKDISDHIYQLIYISLWFYCSGLGCQNLSKMTIFRPKMRILWHNADSLELLNPKNDWPWHCPTTYLKAKNGNISPWNARKALRIGLITWNSGHHHWIS